MINTDDDRQMTRLEEIKNHVEDCVDSVRHSIDLLTDYLDDFERKIHDIDDDDLNACLRLGLVPEAEIKIDNKRYTLKGYQIGGSFMKFIDSENKEFCISCDRMLKAQGKWKLVKQEKNDE